MKQTLQSFSLNFNSILYWINIETYFPLFRYELFTHAFHTYKIHSRPNSGSLGGMDHQITSRYPKLFNQSIRTCITILVYNLQ